MPAFDAESHAVCRRQSVITLGEVVDLLDSVSGKFGWWIPSQRRHRVRDYVQILDADGQLAGDVQAVLTGDLVQLVDQGLAACLEFGGELEHAQDRGDPVLVAGDLRGNGIAERFLIPERQSGDLRDPFEAGQRLLIWLPVCRRLSAEQVRRHDRCRIGAGPVSYTHLTL